MSLPFILPFLFKISVEMPDHTVIGIILTNGQLYCNSAGVMLWVCWIRHAFVGFVISELVWNDSHVCSPLSTLEHLRFKYCFCVCFYLYTHD